MNPLAGQPIGWRGLTLLGPLKCIQISQQNVNKVNMNLIFSFPVFQKLCKRCPKRISPSSWAMWAKFGYFEFFQNFTPLTGSTKKSSLRLPTGSRGQRSMPNLVEIHPVVEAPNSNKQTHRQTGLFLHVYHIYKLSGAPK